VQLQEADKMMRRGVVQMVNAIGFAPIEEEKAKGEEAPVKKNTPSPEM